MNDAVYHKVLLKMQAICAKKEYCTRDIQQKLEKHSISDDQKADILNQLKSDGFIDEQRYSQAFAHDKMKFGKWGKQKIRFALNQKQIPENYIDSAVQAIPNNEYTEMVLAEMRKKWRQLPSAEPWEKKTKLLRFGASRGYEYDIMNAVIDNIAI